MKVNIFSTTIAQKVLVGLSGLMLCGFLVVHLVGNLLIYSPADDYKVYNDYAHAIHTNPLLPAFEIVLLALFLTHVALSIATVVRNRMARPQAYAVKRSKRGKSRLTAHNVMHWTGLVVLAFVLLHLLDFRFAVRYPEQPGVTPAHRALLILHDPLSASLYTVGSLLLGYHLYHGFQSAFETLGAANPRVTPFVRRAGAVFALVVAVGFASFPIWVNLFAR